MDGLKRRLTDSLQSKLSLWLSLTILAVASIAGSSAFFLAYDEAEELQDDMLRQVATFFARRELAVPQAGGLGEEAHHHRESRVYVQVLSTDPSVGSRATAGPPLAVPPDLSEGLQTVKIGKRTYRVLVRAIGSGERLAVAQETAIRSEIARDGALLALLPFLILVPILLLVVAYMVRKIFKPVADLSREIDQRGDEELHPIAGAPLPAEIRPFVLAINRLLRRVEQSMDAQRRFVGDAAHELRSPLTALSLQAERLADAEMPASARERLNTLRQGIERGRALLEQLLSLARAQSSPITPPARLSVLQVYRRVLEDLMPLAEVKEIDIGVACTTDAEVLANELELTTIVKNLVGNAIRFTPAGGRVDLSIVTVNGEIALLVEDNGPGIPEAERLRVFDPFYRVLGRDEIGSGLGLSIVQTIAARLGARVSLGFADDRSRSGLRVMVIFPAPGNRECE